MDMDANVQSGMKQVRESGGRIGYLDALRGFIMLVIVTFHVTFFCFHATSKVCSFTWYLMQITLPMFFFISGFLVYRPDVKWDLGYLGRFLRRKIPYLLIGATLFFLLYVYVFDRGLSAALFTGGKCGYWFTYVLLIFFLIYGLVRFAVREPWADVVLIALGIALYVTSWPGYRAYVPVSGKVLALLSVDFWHLFIFLVIGTLARKHFAVVERLLDGKWLVTVCLLVYFLVNIFQYHIPVSYKLLSALLAFAGIVILFAFFRHRQVLFSRQTMMGSALQLVGRRTLDIYLIHFFLIPYNLSLVSFFADHPMPLVELIVSGSLALVIVGVSLVVSNVIRLSPLLARWLFGAKA